MKKEHQYEIRTIVLNDNIDVYVNVCLSYQNGMIIKNTAQLIDDKTHLL